MNFKRAKSILILLFALVDIFLLIIYQLVYVKTKSLSNEDIIAILNNNNITITSEVLSRDFPARVPEIEISNLAKNKKNLYNEGRQK